MAVKTITIDMAAYTLLSHHKAEGQSFSQVIKAHFAPRPTAGRFLAAAKKVRLSEETIDAIEGQIRDRHKSPVRMIDL